jgi:hypothetical protein
MDMNERMHVTQNIGRKEQIARRDPGTAIREILSQLARLPLLTDNSDAPWGLTKTKESRGACPPPSFKIDKAVNKIELKNAREANQQALTKKRDAHLAQHTQLLK